MNIVEVLEAARAKIADPAKWCKGSSAQRADGQPLFSDDARSPDAVKWCAVGACVAVAPGPYGRALDFFEAAIGTPRIGKWNDDDKRTHDEVLAAFDKAIALAKAGATP